jgi:hypothetical protein
LQYGAGNGIHGGVMHARGFASDGMNSIASHRIAYTGHARAETEEACAQ